MPEPTLLRVLMQTPERHQTGYADSLSLLGVFNNDESENRGKDKKLELFPKLHVGK